MWLRKIEKRNQKKIDDMINEPLILETIEGDIYGGLVDDAYVAEDFLCLYNCKLLDKIHQTWIEHNFYIKINGILEKDFMPYFSFSEISKIYALPEYLNDDFGLFEALQIFIDPHFKPIPSISCTGTPDTNHSKECDKDLHNVLIKIRIIPMVGYQVIGKEKIREFTESFIYLRRWLLKMGAQIP